MLHVHHLILHAIKEVVSVYYERNSCVGLVVLEKLWTFACRIHLVVHWSYRGASRTHRALDTHVSRGLF